jgi:surface protein
MQRLTLILLVAAVVAAACDHESPTALVEAEDAPFLSMGAATAGATLITKAMCRNQWQSLGFKNHGQCVSYAETGKARMGFETTWDTRLGAGTTVTLGLAGEVGATIYWGDGTFTRVNMPGPHTHAFGTEGVYTVSVTGRATAYGGWGLPDREKLVSIDSWGDLGFTSLFYAFPDTRNLVSVPRTTAGLESVTTMGGMFYGASKFNSDIRRWDVSNVTIMMSMFGDAASFNQDIGGWDVSNVTNMNGMFNGAKSFNQDIGDWNVSRVNFMVNMFGGTDSFDQDIGRWDVSNVVNMNYMFMNASAFNQDIGNWDVSNVAVMISMFNGATSFNQDIGGWDVSNVTPDFWGWTGMQYMFNDAASFNQDLSGWCVAQIQDRPDGFDDGAHSWMLPRPLWGTCPGAG